MEIAQTLTQNLKQKDKNGMQNWLENKTKIQNNKL